MEQPLVHIFLGIKHLSIEFAVANIPNTHTYIIYI